MLIHVKEKTVTVSLREFDIPNFDIKVCTQKSELPQVNLLTFLTQPGIIRQITF